MVLDPVAQLHLVTILAIIAIFVMTLMVLRRTVFLPLISVMEARTARIEAARAGKVEAAAGLAAAQAEATRILDGARETAAGIVEKAHRDAAEAGAARIAEASAEAEAILARGREETEALRQSEAVRLGEELHACIGREVLARSKTPPPTRVQPGW
jgi:F-type H+-transporting ATPase subunit b